MLQSRRKTPAEKGGGKEEIKVFSALLYGAPVFFSFFFLEFQGLSGEAVCIPQNSLALLEEEKWEKRNFALSPPPIFAFLLLFSAASVAKFSKFLLLEKQAPLRLMVGGYGNWGDPQVAPISPTITHTYLIFPHISSGKRKRSPPPPC